MKKILFIFLILLNSCYWDEDLNNYNNNHNNLSKSQEYFWYYNKIFEGVDTVQLVGKIESETSEDIHYINRSFKVYNDTIYIKRRNFYPSHNIYNGIIIINKNEYKVDFILQ